VVSWAGCLHRDGRPTQWRREGYPIGHGLAGVPELDLAGEGARHDLVVVRGDADIDHPVLVLLEHYHGAIARGHAAVEQPDGSIAAAGHQNLCVASLRDHGRHAAV
jgi:hypothetical protein